MSPFGDAARRLQRNFNACGEAASSKQKKPHRLANSLITFVDKRCKVKYILVMKVFRWNIEKNKKLKKERGISFEDILFYIREGNLLSTIRHPNPDKYKNQFIFIVNINNYAYAVPFIETEEEIFLKTIFPSRNYTKKYLEGKHEI